MVHDALIIIHAAGGAIAFITGFILMVLLVRRRINIWLFWLFVVSLVAMIITLLAVVGVDWPELDLGARIIFSGLGALALYMGWRAAQAASEMRQKTEKWPFRLADHIGFNMISLFDGFVVILVIDLGGPIWLVVILAILAVIFGIWAINKVKSRIKA